MARPEVTGCKPADSFEPLPRLAFSITEFCEAHRLSRAQYYELKKRALTPRETRLGPQTIVITKESAAEWRAQMTEPPAAA